MIEASDDRVVIIQPGLFIFLSGSASSPPVVTTSTRPLANTLRPGESVYDSTIRKPIFSDGIAWRDSQGVIA